MKNVLCLAAVLATAVIASSIALADVYMASSWMHLIQLHIGYSQMIVIRNFKDDTNLKRILICIYIFAMTHVCE